MAKFKCPYCHELHDVLECKLVCKRSTCPMSYLDEDNGSIRPAYYSYCLNKCKSAAVQVFCPNQDVMERYNRYVRKYQINKDVGLHLDIPSELYDGTPTLTVAILGGVSSGKTSYLTVLLNQIDNKLRNAYECSMRILNTATQETYRNRYYNFVYKDGSLNEKTLANDSIPPLLYSLEFPDNPKKKQRVNLAFYDVAGEDLRGTDKMVEDLGYITTADLIVVLLDPLQMPSVRKKLQGKVALPNQTEAPTAILDRLISAYRSVWRIRGKIDVPIAVAFSKMDILQDNEFFSDEDSPIFKEAQHIMRQGFVQSEFDSTQNIMRAIFANYVESNPVPTLKMNFKNYALFGFSALGMDPGVREDCQKEVEPYRVLDPLIWALYRNGYIKKI